MRSLFLGVIVCMATVCGLLVAFGIILGFFLFGVSVARAHDMYSDWRDNQGMSCCNSMADSMFGDCRPTVVCDPGNGGLGVMAEGRCVPVPPQTILKIPSPDGRSHVCMLKGAPFPRCVVIGEPRS